MRIEITFAGDSHDAVISSEEVTKAVRKLFVQAEETAQAVQEIKVSQAQAAESAAATRRIAQGIEQIGQEARRSRHEVEQLKLATAGTGGGFGGFLPGGARPRTAAVGLLGLLGVAGSGPVGAGAAAVGVGAAGLIGPAVASVGVLVAAFHGLGDAIKGDRQAFEKLDGQTQQFVQTVRSLIPWLHQLQGIARAGILPGVDKALHDLLSPQNAAAIQRATGGIAGATGRGIAGIGQTVFGSPDFQRFLNNLGTHGARDVELMADSVGHLAHGLVVLLNAGQPVADWLARVTNEGARFVDSWLKGKAATGELTGALEHGRAEFELVAKLVAALARAVFNLARDLEPLGNAIIADLTKALNNMAHWLEQNRQLIADITTGALNALIAALKIAWPLVETLARALKDVADAVGGWKVAFEIVIAGGVVVGINKIAEAVYGLRTALLIANPELAALLIAATAIAAIAYGVTHDGTTPGSGQIAVSDKRIAAARKAHPGNVPIGITYDASGNLTERINHYRPDGTFAGSTDKPVTLQQAARILGMSEAALAKKLSSGTGPQSNDPRIGYTDASKQTSTGPDGKKTTFVPGQAPTPLAGSLGSYYVQPVAPGAKFERFDQGVDWRGRPGDYVVAIGNATIDAVHPNAGGFGQAIYYTLADGPAAGTQIYVGHAQPLVKAGDKVARGQKIARLLQRPLGNAAGIPGHTEIGVASGNTPVSTSEKDTGSAKGFYAFLQGQQTTPTNTSAPPPGTADPFGTAPPFTADKGANILPAAIRLAIAKAGTTPGTRDDRAALQQAISWLRANVSGFTGEDQINAYLELASLLGQLKALAPKVAKHRKPALASAAGRISAGGEAAGLVGLLTGDPFAATLARPESLEDAQKHLRAVRHALLPEIREIEKDISEKTLTAQALATLRAQMGQYKKTITSAVDDVRAAIERQKTAFQAAWQKLGDTMIAQLEQKRGSYKSPARMMLDELTATHDTQALQDALTQANTDLATALKGHQQDAQQQLDAIRQYVGTSFLVNAIDATQSAILGGQTVQISGEAILAKMHDLLTAGGNVVDPDEVKRAQKAVEDAKYTITVAGLEKTATAEETAYNQQLDAQEKLIRDMQDNWEKYFTNLRGDIGKAKQVWLDYFSSIGLTPGGVSSSDSTGSAFFQGFPAGTTFDALGIPNGPASAAAAGQIGDDAFFKGFPAGTWFDALGIPHAPGFQVGGPVPHDMLAQVHRGEYVVPAGGTLVKGGGDGGGQQFNVILEGDLAALGDFVTVKAVEAHDQIGRRIGLSADRRRRGGTY